MQLEVVNQSPYPVKVDLVGRAGLHKRLLKEIPGLSRDMVTVEKGHTNSQSVCFSLEDAAQVEGVFVKVPNTPFQVRLTPNRNPQRV